MLALKRANPCAILEMLNISYAEQQTGLLKSLVQVLETTLLEDALEIIVYLRTRK